MALVIWRLQVHANATARHVFTPRRGASSICNLAARLSGEIANFSRVGVILLFGLAAAAHSFVY